MKNLTVLMHEKYLKHDTGYGHPERPARLRAIFDHLEETGLEQEIEMHKARSAHRDDILMVHEEEYFGTVQNAWSQGRRVLDGGDTRISEGSFEAAMLAAGAAVEGMELIRNGNSKRVFCAVRPPGHHAESDFASGFCLFNNAAIAARRAQSIGLAQRILILDWDVHHGNGSQHSFEYDDTVFYYSIHQYPHFPGTGAASETGRGKGVGYTLNRPLGPGNGDDTYLSLLNNDLEYIGEFFNPDMLIISAGFDAHKDDPLSGMNVSTDGFRRMTRTAVQFSGQYCQGRILSVFEGGYELSALSESVHAHLTELMER